VSLFDRFYRSSCPKKLAASRTGHVGHPDETATLGLRDRGLPLEK
jgi:hypothetical protein